MRHGAMSLALVVIAVGLQASACVPAWSPDDAGAPAPTCLGDGERSVRAGHTGVDFVAIKEGDELPAWTRPQGGIGTRINVSLTGFAEDALFDGLTVQFLGTAGDGASCAAVDDPACSELETCDDGQCRLLLGNQTNVRFPLECLFDGSIHIAELPVRFRNQFQLDQLDGVEQELRVIADPREGETVSSSVLVTLNVGDFIQPSWWDTGEP